MKKFKELRKEIVNEKHGYAVGNAPSVAHGRYQVDKKDGETLNNIRQAINHELQKGYLSPTNAVEQLRVRLNLVGFDFDMKDVPSEGKVSFPLKNATETFGKKLDTPYDEFAKDDSSAGMTLTVNIKTDENSLYKLSGSVS
jgi:hypothetical protein